MTALATSIENLEQVTVTAATLPEVPAAVTVAIFPVGPHAKRLKRALRSITGKSLD